jgi:hypothetical protein
MISGGNPKGGAIIAGTLGKSSIIDRLVAEGKLDVAAIEGAWEAYVSTTVSDPIPGVAEAMVVAGKHVRLMFISQN